MLRASLPAIVLVLVTVGTSSSSAAFPGRNGRIAFEHVPADGSPASIYTVTTTGKKRHRLARGPSLLGMTAYSRNGRKIAFVRCPKRCDLWTMRSDGTHQRRVMHSGHLDALGPAWSPNGKKIVFAALQPSQDNKETALGLWVVGSDGRGLHQLTSSGGGPSWSPDGTKIAFSDHGSIFVVPPTGGSPTDLSTGAPPGHSDYEPDWSPDGSQIVFASDRSDTFESDLWLMNADGSGLHQVTNTPDLDEYDPTWSPDGRWIAYTGSDQHKDLIYVSRPDGSGVHVVPHGGTRHNRDPSWQPLPR